MGATTWKYFVPYQEDVDKALEELREDVFRSGEYELPYSFREMATDKLESIQQLRELAAEEGTHSILDIYQISDEADFGSVCPLPEEALVQIFGTATPTHSMVDAEQFGFEEYVRRWQGIYFPVFENGQPTELFFWGYSGD